jgi:hypothetical protein
MRTKKTKRLLLSGPVLVGFADVFDRSFGNPKTPRPYPKVTPSAMCGVLLPFECPHCGEVRSQPIDPKTRLGYHDKQRDFSWCPACKGRYVIDPKGTPLVGSLPSNATHAPALVERGNKSEVVGLLENNGLDMLGAQR